MDTGNQSSNNHSTPSSLMVKTVDPRQPESGLAETQQRKVWPILLIFGLVGLLVGLVVGGIYFWQCPTVYRSEAIVKIEPRDKVTWQVDGNQDQRDFAVRHDQLIAEDNILTKCLKEHGLKDLPTLRDLPTKDQISRIQKNFIATSYGYEPMTCELEYFSSDPRDAQTVVATIVSTYQNYLDEKYRDPSSDTIELLNKMRDKFQQEIESVDKQLERARERAEASEESTEEVEELIRSREKAKEYLARVRHIIDESTSFWHRRHKGFNFEIVQPACRGREVWPSPVMILPLAGLIGSLFGLGVGGWVAIMVDDKAR